MKPVTAAVRKKGSVVLLWPFARDDGAVRRFEKQECAAAYGIGRKLRQKCACNEWAPIGVVACFICDCIPRRNHYLHRSDHIVHHQDKVCGLRPHRVSSQRSVVALALLGRRRPRGVKSNSGGPSARPREQLGDGVPEWRQSTPSIVALRRSRSAMRMRCCYSSRGLPWVRS